MCVKGVWSVCYCKVFIKHKSGVASKRGASLAGNTGDVSVYRVKNKNTEIQTDIFNCQIHLVSRI